MRRFAFRGIRRPESLTAQWGLPLRHLPEAEHEQAIPVNAPQCPFANQQRDGHMQMAMPQGRVAYEPSSLAPDSPREAPDAGFRTAALTESGDKGRIRAERFADHYSQARQFYRSQTGHEQAHIASALVFELSKLEHAPVPQAMVGHLRHIDEDLAQRVADGLGFESLPSAPTAALPVQDFPPSPALQIIGKMKDSLAGRVIGILVADGSERTAVEVLRAAATGAGASVKIVAPKVCGPKLADGERLAADGQLAGTPSVMFDAVAILLSDEGAEQLSTKSAAIDFVRDAFSHLNALAIDHGGQVLLKVAGIESDEGIVDVNDVAGFLAAAKTRQWDREKTVRTLA